MSIKFPYLHSTTALMCIMGSIQGAIFALCIEKDWSQWKLGWNVRLLAVTFMVRNCSNILFSDDVGIQLINIYTFCCRESLDLL